GPKGHNPHHGDAEKMSLINAVITTYSWGMGRPGLNGIQEVRGSNPLTSTSPETPRSRELSRGFPFSCGLPNHENRVESCTGCGDAAGVEGERAGGRVDRVVGDVVRVRRRVEETLRSSPGLDGMPAGRNLTAQWRPVAVSRGHARSPWSRVGSVK